MILEPSGDANPRIVKNGLRQALLQWACQREKVARFAEYDTLACGYVGERGA